MDPAGGGVAHAVGALRRPGLDQRPLLGARRPALRLRPLRADLILTVASRVANRITSAIRRRRTLANPPVASNIPAMALPPGFLDELRARVSIVAVVGRKVTWDSRKTNAARGDYWAPCPFHQEKTASFHVEEAKGRYHCFGCHAGGDVVSFLRETEGLGFMEAVERLAAEAGMEMPARDPAAAARAAANQGLAEAMEAAVRFYRAQLNGARAAEARAYLDRRGLTAATLERFEIGYAPDGRTDLARAPEDKGFARETLAEAGLVGLPKDGGALRPLPQPHHVPDPRRRAAGRSPSAPAPSRAGQEPKYLNSPETAALRQGPHPLQPRPGPRRGRQGRHARRHRGLYGRDRARRGRHRPRRRAARHRDHRGPARGALEARARAGGRARRRRRRARRGAAADRPRAAAARPPAARCASRCCRRARTPTTWCAPAARRRCRRSSTPRGRSSRCSGSARPPARCSTAPSAAPPSTPACARTSRRSPTPALRAHWEREIRDRPRGALRAGRGRRPRRQGPRAGAPAPGRRAPAGRGRRPRRKGSLLFARRRRRRPRRACGRARSSPAASTTRRRARRSRTGWSASPSAARDLGAVRDALLSALGDARRARAASWPRCAARLGHDPLPALAGCRPGACQPPPARRRRSGARARARSTRS